jgi:hypothetical protein
VLEQLAEGHRSIQATVAPTTAVRYQVIARVHLGWAAAAADPVDLTAFKAYLAAKGRSPSTVRCYVNCARRACVAAGLGQICEHRRHRCALCSQRRHDARKYCRRSSRKDRVDAEPGATRAERFAVKIRAASNGCEIWIGSLNRGTRGYGQFWDGTRLVKAHRWAYEQKHGPVDPELTIDHLCGETRCVNVDHLRVITRSENARLGALKRLAA